MGYVTEFEIDTVLIETIDSKETIIAAAKEHAATLPDKAFNQLSKKEQEPWLRKVRTRQSNNNPLNKYIKTCGCTLDVMQSCNKWYEYREDILEISEECPGWLITVYGDGEDKNDLWVHYFYNGKDEKFDIDIKYPQTTLLKKQKGN